MPPLSSGTSVICPTTISEIDAKERSCWIVLAAAGFDVTVTFMLTPSFVHLADRMLISDGIFFSSSSINCRNSSFGDLIMSSSFVRSSWYFL